MAGAASGLPGYAVTLAGNPNVGKSTLFNALTGGRQHTGNWPGKTVETARGTFTYKGLSYTLTDLPGTYSLQSRSQEEAVAQRALLTQRADCVVVVCDAVCLERSLLLALQILEAASRVVVCVNLLDQAEKQGLRLDLRALERALGVPVAGASASLDQGLEGLCERVRSVCQGYETPRPVPVLTPDMDPEQTAQALCRRASELSALTVRQTEAPKKKPGDWVFTHPVTGPLILLLGLLAVFWFTVSGANVISGWLQAALDWLLSLLRQGAAALRLPDWITAPLLDGVYVTLARVVAAMLPPMAVFFPLFTLLEEVGYLPRAAFLLDRAFSKAGACGKQALTMCMGLGCNAVGVVGCRIIDSRREQHIAIVTNAMTPCNGRFPALILLGCGFFGLGAWGSMGAAVLLTALFALSLGVTLLSSRLLSRTVLRAEPSSFTLELPPFRRPRILRVMVRSLRERTLRMLGRAAAVAAPMGLVLWLLTRLPADSTPILWRLSQALDPAGQLLGMDGALLLAFILGFPANELVLPIAVMVLSAGSALGSAGTEVLPVLCAAGWSWKTAACAMVFCLFHWPCATTCLTIRRETGSLGWTLFAIALPTAVGALLCLCLRLLFG